ncbi:putative protein FAM86A-like 2 [Wickerhamomyces ciferrii]|uniref:Uncharacterized protein n=1 Tax=Wickerhamomyces ciferrii (strain ATCC 14091 / BCRC 22168 / CBS 111 / JCM 3599 / NBRC 0793 / NRRL Y-1031 F-60-10) TaxID=1206466 RepID=K0KNX7_WICCF|nr:putative protein FAM86A-like 2 [Wickerhamomyces ciferrii]CCH46980.1 putative protein FAM86A-like 2 [Wickerhamomyces ciferrii]
MDRLINNLFQRVPINEVVIPENIDSDLLLNKITEISQENPYYIKNFLNKLFKTDIDQDEFYELFAELIHAKPMDVTHPDIITYKVGDTKIKIKETPRVISGGGTTGLRTWEAALYLSNNFLSQNYKNILSGKSILELGTGTGLVSLYTILSENFQVKDLVITDGDSTLIESLGYNFQLNNLDLSKTKCQSLWWGIDHIPEGIDTILAADVTYDSSVIPSLVDCIRTGLEQGVKDAFIAATIRNEETIVVFEKELTNVGLKWEIVDKCTKPGELENSSVWYAKTTPEIRIYKINK